MAHRYYVDEVKDGRAYVRGGEASHLARVMRAREGDTLTVSDRDGHDYSARILSASPDEVELEILAVSGNPADPKKRLTVYMALPKADKLEMIVQKCCELGAARVIPFESRYCVAQKSKRDDAKRSRLQKIADEACKQCGRSRPMEVGATLTFGGMLKELEKHEARILFYERGTEPLTEAGLSGKSDVAIVIGSEGGFSEEEAAKMTDAGAVSVVLGARILRCETAAIAAAAMTMLLMGEME